MSASEPTVIRAVTSDDLEMTREWRNDRRVWNSTLGRRFPITEEGERHWFESLNRGAFPTDVVWAIADESGNVIGVVQLNHIDWIHRTAYFGVWVGPDHWGRGHASRATRLTCGHALHDFGLRQIRLQVLAGHDAARAVYVKNGFVSEAVLVGAALINGKPIDLEIMVLTEQSWGAASEQGQHRQDMLLAGPRAADI